MPAAAVIPAPIAYIKVAAVKKLVVGFLAWLQLARHGYVCECRCASAILLDDIVLPFTGLALHVSQIFYFEKIRVFKAGFLL